MLNRTENLSENICHTESKMCEKENVSDRSTVCWMKTCQTERKPCLYLCKQTSSQELTPVCIDERPVCYMEPVWQLWNLVKALFVYYRLIAEKINKNERKGKSEIEVLPQGSEESAFWRALNVSKVEDVKPIQVIFLEIVSGVLHTEITQVVKINSLSLQNQEQE